MFPCYGWGTNYFKQLKYLFPPPPTLVIKNIFPNSPGQLCGFIIERLKSQKDWLIPVSKSIYFLLWKEMNQFAYISGQQRNILRCLTQMLELIIFILNLSKICNKKQSVSICYIIHQNRICWKQSHVFRKLPSFYQ